MKKLALSLALAGSFVLPFISRAQFASAVISYTTGTGFAAGFTNASAALSAPASGAGITPFAPPFSKTQILSIGAGGQLTLQLSSPISHDASHPYGLDFEIFANQFFSTSGGNVAGLFDHAATETIQVSVDGATWYTLNPTLAPMAGALYPTDGNGNPFIPVNPSLTLGNFTGLNAAGVSTLYAGSAGGTGYDLAWAQDGNGNPVSLTGVDYIRISLASGVLDLDAVSVVPEPSVTALLLVSLPLLAFCVYRKKNFTPAKIMLKSTKLLLFTLFAAASVARADTNSFTENFTGNPLTNGWQIFGATNLFSWDATNHDLNVTWDSSQTNSYFYHPLGVTLTSKSSFGLDFDLLLNDATINGGTFQLAVGFLNLSNAIDPTFLRGTGFNSSNIVEFDYFMDPFFGNSLAASENDTNGEFADVYDNLPLNTGATYHISLTYFAGEPVVSAQVTTGGQVYSLMTNVYIEAGFGNFAVDTLAIPSYSDSGAYGASILAHGTVANLAFTTSPNPLGNFSGQLAGTNYQAQFKSHTNWLYTLERSTDLRAWNAVTATNGDGTMLTLQDTNLPTTKAFYRMHASKP